mmetsp:Transcript_53333/g.100029  ORF Transcript_53333/g.100029 Transcript_53333/m.100029 type:complete len:83 (-) Transcript_53333:2879-3127(-)
MEKQACGSARDLKTAVDPFKQGGLVCDNRGFLGLKSRPLPETIPKPDPGLPLQQQIYQTTRLAGVIMPSTGEHKATGMFQSW